jgi:hypothetical protein
LGSQAELNEARIELVKQTFLFSLDGLGAPASVVKVTSALLDTIGVVCERSGPSLEFTVLTYIGSPASPVAPESLLQVSILCGVTVIVFHDTRQ